MFHLVIGLILLFPLCLLVAGAAAMCWYDIDRVVAVLFLVVTIAGGALFIHGLVDLARQTCACPACKCKPCEGCK